jgi:PglZ domain
MAIVTEYLFQLIARQVEEHSLVVWYDPRSDYQTAAERFEIPGTTIARYDGSFLKLRREIDTLMGGLEPPRLVVYVPVEQSHAHHALVELEEAGVVMQPGQVPAKCNTRLALVARNALKNVIGDENAAEVEKQVDQGKLTLKDVDALGLKGQDITHGVVSIIFGTGNSQEVALAFLASEKFDAEIEKKAATTELAGLLHSNFEVELPDNPKLADIRERLTRHILLTDLAVGLGNAVPSSLASIKIAGTTAAVVACTGLARNWRLRRDVRESYVGASQIVEQDFSLSKLDLDAKKIVAIETFQAVERALLRHVEESLLEKATDDLLALAKSRLASFWADVLPAIQARWALISSAAEVLLEASRVGNALKKAPTNLPDLVKAYADDGDPWCLLDTHHRHMESRKYNFEFAANNDHDGLEKLITKAEQRYTEVGSELARLFVTQVSKAKQPIKGLARQRDIFELHVKPKLRESKLAYVWVDALRFEMARELARLLEDDFALTIEAAVASVPTITEIGMAALLPRAGQSAKVVAVGTGKLGLQIDRTVIKDRKDRVAFLKEHTGVPVFDAKLDDLLPKPSKRIKDGVQGAQLVLITSQEIDELGETDNSTQSRRQMDGVLHDLRRGVRILTELGFKTIVLAADHGHLFGEEIGEDMKIEAPGGETADLHRRVWIGQGGTSEPSYLRAPLSSLGIDSDLDLATPWTFACFKSKGGARAYFHGGLSPQELIIPVLTMTPTGQSLAGPPAGIEWKLSPGSAKLSTRFLSVQITGLVTRLFDIEPPKVRIEVRAGKKVVSRPVSASYGFEDGTGEVKLKTALDDPKTIEPNTVTLMIIEEFDQKTVGIHLIDASSGAELKSLEKIEVAISM